MKRLVLSFFILHFSLFTLLAVPAKRGPIEREQPNGEKITVRLYGDERKHWMTTDDGYLVCENQKGYICYAVRVSDSAIKASCRKAHNVEQRTKAENRYLKRKGIKKS